MINVLESIIHTSLSSHLLYKTAKIKEKRKRQCERENEVGRLNMKPTVIDKHLRSSFKIVTYN